jgi:hypothetical protein
MPMPPPMQTAEQSRSAIRSARVLVTMLYEMQLSEDL